MPQNNLKSSIAIIGCGDVGSTLAYSLLLQPICNEIILVDPKKDLVEAQVRDLNDASFRGSSGIRVKVGDHKEAGNADIIVVTAGAAQKKGEDRLSLVSRNLAILRSIFDSMQPINPDAILLLVANPVDVITHFARKISGLPPSQVLGTGTSLDSARLRGALATELDVAPNSVNAFVLGEHGDSQFVHWSGVSVGTTPLSLLHGSSLTPEFKDRVSKHTAGAAASIIAAKGCTAFGIGNIAASLCKYILYDQRTVRPVSFYQEDLGVTLSMPAVVGRKGIVRSIPVELDEEEKKALEKTAKALREVIEKSEKELDKMEKEDK